MGAINCLKKKKKLLSLHGREGVPACEEGKKLHTELRVMLDQEDIRWSQRAKEAWLKHGDMNTLYLHECANARRRKNFIGKIMDDTGQLWETPDKVELAFVIYFSNLFTAGETGDMEPCLQHINLRVSRAMNTELLMEFSKDEISAALRAAQTG